MTRFTLSVFGFFVLVVLQSYASAAALVGRASSVPSCFTCPPTDNGGFAVVTETNTNGVLFCSYPADPSENPDDFYCNYDSATGALTQDHDAGFCPATAVQVSCASRRDDNFKAVKRRAATRAAQPEPAGLQAKRSRKGKGDN